MSLIVVEGLDLAGKSTLVEGLSKVYKSRVVSEPFAESNTSKEIRTLIRGSKHEPIYETQLLLASRIEMFAQLNHYAVTNSPAYLISDRSFISNMVYQASNLEEMKRIMSLNIDVLSKYGYDCIPDMVFYLEVPYEVAKQRFDQRVEVNNLDLKVMQPDTYHRMQEKYNQALMMLSSYNKRVKVVRLDGEEILAKAITAIDDQFRFIDSITVSKKQPTPIYVA